MNLFKRYVFCIFYCILLSSVLPAQDYFTTVQHYTTADGLSDNYISDTYEDSKGYIWIATTSGLNRFDGHEFIRYSSETNNLSSNYIERIFEDKNGLLWIVSRGKWNTGGFAFFTKLIDVFDPVNEQSIPLKEFINAEFKESEIRWYQGDHEKNVWFSTTGGALYKYDGSQFYKIFEKEVGDSWNGQFDITTEGNIAYMVDKQFLYLDASGKTIFEFSMPYYMDWLYRMKDGGLCLGTVYSSEFNGGKLMNWKLDAVNRRILPFPMKYKNGNNYLLDSESGVYNSFELDSEDRVWIFAEDRFLLFDSNGIMLLDLTYILEEYDIVPKSIFLNFSSNDFCWLSTEKGTFSIALRKNKFQDVLDEKVYNIYGGMVDDGLRNILINKGDEIIRLDQKHQELGSIPIPFVSEMIYDGAGTIWIGDRFSGIHGYDVGKNKYQTYFPPLTVASGIRDNLYILSLHALKEEPRLLVGRRFGGVLEFDITDKELKPYQQYNSFDKLKESVVNHFLENDQGIWMATNNGLFLMDRDKGIIAHHMESIEGITFNEIYHFHIDGDGTFWLGTNGDGLIRWNPDTNKARQFTQADGLSHQRVYAIYEDDFGKLWLPSGYGIMQFDKHSHEVLVWLEEDGLPFDDFLYHFHHQMPDGRLYFGGGNGGVASFLPADLGEMPEPIEISSYQEFDNRSGLFVNQNQKIQQRGTLHIPPNVNTVMFKASMFEYTAPSNIKYAYRVSSSSEPIDISEPGWTYLPDNIIQLNNLPYGEHELQVFARAADNNKTQGQLILPFVMEKPFYLKTGFILLAILVTIGMIFAFLKWRTFQLEKDKKRLEQEVEKRTVTIEEQTVQLKEQMTDLENANKTKDRLMAIIGHDLRGPLFSLQGLEEQINYLLETGQTERLKELGGAMEKSTKYLTDTLNNLLNWSMNQMGAFPYQPVTIPLASTTKKIFDLFEGNAKSKSIGLRLDVPEETEVYMDKNALNTILRNLVSNAIKFTKSNGEVAVNGIQENGQVLLKITDSGVGMPEESINKIIEGKPVKNLKGTKGEKSTGLGLMLCRELLHQNQGSMKIKSEEGKGTTFILELPAAQPES